MTDFSQYAPRDRVGEIRVRLAQPQFDAIRHGTRGPLDDVAEFRSQASAIDLTAAGTPLAGAEFDRNRVRVDRLQGRREEDLKRAAMTYDLSQRAQDLEDADAEREAATGAAERVTNALGSGVRNLLGVLDAPRRLTFEHAVLPAAKALGRPIPEDPEGRALYMKALGGEDAAAFLESKGLPSLVGRDVLPAVAGFGLDVLFDPLTYLSLGAGGVLKAGGRKLTQTGGAALLAELRSAPALTDDAVRALRTEDTISKLGVLGKGLGGTDPGGRVAQAVAGAVKTATSPADIEAAAHAVLGRRQKDLVAKISTATASAADPAEAADNVLAELLGRNVPMTLRNDVDLAGGALASAKAPVKEPLIDDAFANLRAFGADDLFVPGGLSFRLPKDALGVRVPLLNPEESLSVYLGGRQIDVLKRNLFDDVRRTAVGLGSAGLAVLPLPAQQAVKGLGAAAGRAAGAVTDAVGVAFVPYHLLQGKGSEALVERIKNYGKMSPVVREQTSRELSRVWTGVTAEQKASVQYLLDLGAVEKDAAGDTVYQTLDDLAAQLNDFNQSVPGITGLATDQAPTPATADELAKRFKQQATELEAFKTEAGPAALTRMIDPAKVDPDFRDAAEGLLGSLPAADVVDRLISRAKTIAATGQIAKRVGPHDLVGRADFDRLVPDADVRRILEELVTLDTNAWGVPTGGAVTATMRYAQEFGQETFLPSFLRHIHKPVALGDVARPGLPLRRRTPSNIGQQRVTSFLATPEELDALGIVTDPEAILNQTLSQYRTLARQRQFVDWTLQNYGRRVAHEADVDKAAEVLFDPDGFVRKQLPRPDELAERLAFHKLNGDLTPEELAALPTPGALPASGGPKWVLPREVAQALEFNTRLTQNSGGLLAGLDSILAVQRSLATVGHVGYHVRNLVGNALNSMMGGVPLFDARATADAAEVIMGTADGKLPRGLAQLFKGLSGDPAGLGGGAAGRRIANLPHKLSRDARPDLAITGVLERFDPDSPDAFDWFRRYLEEHGVLRTGQTAVDTKVLQQNPPAWTGPLGNALLLGPGRTIGDTTDNLMRVRHVLGRVYRGDSLEEAVLSAKKFLFDYSDLTPFEQNVMRRTAFFYTWTRKNLPLQLEMMVQQPRNIAYYNALFRALQDPEAQRNAEAALMPAWMRESLGIVVGANRDGTLRVITGMGLPIEDLNIFLSSRGAEGTIQKFLGLTNPMVQFVLNRAGLPSGFTGTKIDDPSFQNYYRRLMPVHADLAKQVPGLADWLELEDRTIVDADGNERHLYSGNPWKLYVLYNIFGMGRNLREMGVANELFGDQPGETPGEALERRFYGGAKLLGVGNTQLDISRPLQSLHASKESQAVDAEIGTRLETLAKQLARGEVDPSSWRASRRDLLAERHARREQLLDQQLEREAADLPEAERAQIQTFRDRFVNDGQSRLDDLFSMSPEDTDPDTGKRLYANAREFSTVRQEKLATIKEDYPDAYERYQKIQDEKTAKLPPTARKLEEGYRKAVDLLDQYEEVPKYRNLDDAQTAQADAVQERQRALSRQYGPARARRQVQQEDPEGYRLLQRGIPNTRARQRAWRDLNKKNDGLLNYFFGNLVESEFAEGLAAQAGGEPAPDVSSGGGN
jgi:hypothetical protein